MEERKPNLLLCKHIGSMRQSCFLLVEAAKNVRYYMFADVEFGCKWSARGATSVTEVVFCLFAAYVLCVLVNEHLL